MRVVLGVTGCIGAYKSALILRLLQEEGIDVVPVMTAAAQHFLGPLTLEKLSGHPVVTGLFGSRTSEIEHISLARSSDLLLVAPATANTLAKFANGIADDFLSTLYLSTTRPVIVAPAMNVEMWRHPATCRNLEQLRERGIVVVGPDSGYQACGEFGEGRLAEPEAIVSEVLAVLGRSGSLVGRRVLVTAGPTVEDIDPARFLSNRSSGKMGFAIASEAVRRGAEVHLVAGPTALKPPSRVDLIRVRSAREMHQAVLALFDKADAVIKVAAVADFTPAAFNPVKIKKGAAGLLLDLIRTPDILRDLGSRKTGQILVGFAAESEDLIENAAVKIREKNLDLIVANSIADPELVFGSDETSVTLIDRAGERTALPRLKKTDVAKRILDRVEQLLHRSSEETRGSVSSTY